jgi:hypothetical protein
MSAIGTDRLCRSVYKDFRCWRLTGGASARWILLSLTQNGSSVVTISRGAAGIIMGYLELFDFGEG